MNILQMIYSIEKGGAETYLFSLLNNPNEDMNFFVLCNHKGANHEKIINASDNVKIIRMKNLLDINSARKVANYCKENDIEIIQTHFLRENYIAILSKIFNPKIKVVWTTHLILRNRKIIKIFNRIFSKFVHKIICVSQAVESSFIKEGISPNKTKVIYNGVDTDYFKPIKSSCKTEELVLTTVSRFNQEKGHRFLIEVLNKLVDHLPNFKIQLVGEGEEVNYIKEKVKKYNLEDKVIFLGFREDIPKILAETHIYVSPSKNEAISFSILEALSCSIPVVATDVGGVPEIFNKGKVGVLVPYGDVNGFTKEIVKLYQNRKRYNLIASNCRDVVINNFSKNKMLKETYDIYYQIKYSR